MIKYLIMDVDGTLTDGKIYMGNNGEVMKSFSVKDGYAIKHLLRNYSIEPIVITGRKSDIVDLRCKELDITRVYQGCEDKSQLLLKLVGDDLASCAYIGDDVPDYECMKLIQNHGGTVGCPADAIDEIKEKADYVCDNNGGDGAVREFVDYLISMN